MSRKKVCIVDYGMGNITSMVNAFSYLGFDPELVSEPDLLSNYDNIVLPGVGAFAKAMYQLRRTKLDESIVEAAKNGKKILGICLGMQLLFSRSFEFGETKGLGLVEGDVLPFEKNIVETIPHVGWNNVISQNSLYDDFCGDYYFVHSYFCQPVDFDNITLSSSYGITFCSGVSLNNQVIGLQFHPEKSQGLGLRLLEKVINA